MADDGEGKHKKHLKICFSRFIGVFLQITIRTVMGIFINKGNFAFRQSRNSEYIDKSGLIAEVNKTLFTRQKFTCVTRCRRFGKSMAAEMLAAYYDYSCDSRALFADLQIASAPTFEEHLNKYPVIYGIDYARNSEGKVIVDEDGFPIPGDLAVLGAVSPDFILAVSTGFTWRGLRLSAVFDWKKGGNMYAGTYTMMDYYGTSKRSEDYRKMDSFVFDWEPAVKVTAYDADGNPTAFAPNDIKISGADAGDFFSVMNDISKYFVNDASYLKLREVSLSYPIVKANWGSITANAFGRNILLWTAIPGFDPEASQGNNNMAGGFERFSLPATSSYGCGLTINF